MANPLELPEPIDIKTAQPVDKKYGPYASLSDARTATAGYRYDGMTVKIVGTSQEYWWEASDLSDLGLKVKVPISTSLPIVRELYLAADAADVARMGGAASNSYFTTQSVWDAAVAIATANPTYLIVIHVGSTLGSAVGDITVNTNVASKIKWVGTNSASSAIGNITWSSGNGQTYYFKNLTVGTFGTIGGTTGVNATITAEDAVIGNITYVGSAQSLSLLNCSNFIVGDISISGQGNNPGALYIRSCKTLYLGNITGLLTSSIQCLASPTDGVYPVSIKSITMGITAPRGSTLALNGAFVSGNINFTSTAAFPKTVTLTNTTITGSTTINLTGGTNTFNTINSTFIGVMTFTGAVLSTIVWRGCTTGKVTDMPPNTLFQNCSFYDPATATPVINGIGSGCEFYNCSIVGGSLAIENTPGAVSVKFTGGMSSARSAMGVNVTLT